MGLEKPPGHSVPKHSLPLGLEKPGLALPTDKNVNLTEMKLSTPALAVRKLRVIQSISQQRN